MEEDKSLYGDSAIGRIPVISASGKILAPCKPSKMFSLLEQGKAVVEWNADGTFYLQLSFDPESSVKLPEAAVEAVQVRDYKDVWRLIPPKREYIEGLVEIARSNEQCRRNVSSEDWKYLEAVLEADWEEIKSPAVLEMLAPIVYAILKGLARVEASAPADDLSVHIEELSIGSEDFISLENLERARNLGMRYRTIYRLGKIREEGKLKRSLLNATIEYLRVNRGFRIICQELRKALEDIVSELLSPIHVKLKSFILKKGMERASELLQKCRTTMKWAPQLLSWLKSETYILWLGITKLTNPPL